MRHSVHANYARHILWHAAPSTADLHNNHPGIIIYYSDKPLFLSKSKASFRAFPVDAEIHSKLLVATKLHGNDPRILNELHGRNYAEYIHAHIMPH